MVVLAEIVAAASALYVTVVSLALRDTRLRLVTTSTRTDRNERFTRC